MFVCSPAIMFYVRYDFVCFTGQFTLRSDVSHQCTAEKARAHKSRLNLLIKMGSLYLFRKRRLGHDLSTSVVQGYDL